MESSSRSYHRLYRSARQAIKDAAAAAGTPQEPATERPSTTRPQQDSLKHKLDRLVEDANNYDCREEKQQATKKAKGSGNAVFDVREQEEDVSSEAGDSDDGGEEGVGRIDECLGLMAEAFADDLDVLRKDEHFRGSATNLAAMADMMR